MEDATLVRLDRVFCKEWDLMLVGFRLQTLFVN
jgi:hypothetical protein